MRDYISRREYISREKLDDFFDTHIRGYENCPDKYDATIELKAASHTIPAADVAPVQRWIPVTERLPEQDGEYLVCGRWRGKPIKIWVCERVTLGPIMGWANPAENPVISHWMPRPKPPKEEQTVYDSLKTGLEQAVNGEYRTEAVTKEET